MTPIFKQENHCVTKRIIRKRINFPFKNAYTNQTESDSTNKPIILFRFSFCCCCSYSLRGNHEQKTGFRYPTQTLACMGLVASSFLRLKRSRVFILNALKKDEAEEEEGGQVESEIKGEGEERRK